MKAIIQITALAAAAISLAACDDRDEEVVVPTDAVTPAEVETRTETTEILIAPVPLETDTTRPLATQPRETTRPETVTPPGSEVIEVPDAEITQPEQ